MGSVLVILAEGFESVEAIAPVDILRRAGVEVTIAGLGQDEITSAQGVVVKTDSILSADMGVFDLLFIPGGIPGAINLAGSDTVISVITKHNDAGRHIAAICAAPAKVLAPNGFLDGKNATCYPGHMDEMVQAGKDITLLRDDVVVDGNIITSQGVGTSFELGYYMVEILCNKDLADDLRGKMLVD